MSSMSLRTLPLLLTLLVAACDQSPRFTQAEPGEALSGGTASVTRSDRVAFAQPSANLSPERRLDFSVGNSFFRSPWVIAPATTTARDGLGPLLNTNACQNCHLQDGRGHPPEPGSETAVSLLVRLSVPSSGTPSDLRALQTLGVVPEPTYGIQLQDMAIPGVAPEGKVRFDWQTHTEHFDDGHPVELRQPIVDISKLGYGPMQAGVMTSARAAPPMIGLGLLEAVAEADILAWEDPDDRDGDGISGRANRVWDFAERRTVIGRFGWKAGQPSLNQQNAHAFAGDMGLTTSVLRQDDCSQAQQACRTATSGGDPEVSDNILAAVLFYTRNLAVPQRRAVDEQAVLDGKSLFFQAGCQACHRPELKTADNAAEPELANQTIRPYTDLLLHDMGEGLADGRPDFLASGSEWRTPPLWGIGLTSTVSGHTLFLHDGRARNLMEAILWHGGEAEAARRHVLTFDAEQRAALLAFLNSL